MFRIEHGKGIGRIMLVVALAVISLACVTSAMLVPVPTVQGALYAAHLEKAGMPAAEPTAEGKGICAIAWTAVHLRAARGSDARVLDTVARGAVVTVRSKAGDWWLVELDGRVGYVRGKYLQETECK